MVADEIVNQSTAMSDRDIRQVPTYSYNDVALTYAPYAALAAAVAVIVLYEGPGRFVLFFSLAALGAFFHGLRRIVLPKARTAIQLDAVVSVYYLIVVAVVAWSVVLYPDNPQYGAMTSVIVVAGVYFSSVLFAIAGVLIAAGAWITAAYLVSGTVELRDILQLLLFTPSVAVILRLAVGRTHQALDRARQSEVDTVVELQATLEHLHDERRLRQNSELELLHARKTESLGVLAAGVSHDFNNALLAISALAENIRATTGDKRVQRNAGEIVKAVQQASSVCEQMMTYAGKTPEKHGPVNLGRLARETLPLLKASAGSPVRVKMQNHAGDALVRGTGPQLQQVMINLVTNASEAMHGAGNVTVTVEKQTFDEDLSNVPEGAFGAPIAAGSYYQLSVADTGEGMSEETQLQMFDPYFTTRKSGHGFGLSAVLGIMRSHNATMIVTSELYQGTTFRLLFPEYREDMMDSKVFRVPRSPSQQRTGVRRLLLVDDEELVRTPMAEMVRLLGWDVVEASSGREALEYVAADVAFTIIMIDYRMPDMNGLETLRALRKNGVDAPAILCSGYISEPQETVLAEFNGFLMKPFRRQQLEEQLQAVMT